MALRGSLFVASFFAVLIGACDEKEAPANTGPPQKSKEEFLQVLDKNKDEYVRCEKLRLAAMPEVSGGQQKSGAPVSLVGYQGCVTQYWKKVKADVGPYDQAKADEWFAEWKKGVKLEQ